MSKDKISDYSATANSNTDIGGINIDEGCAPSGINDAIRTLMKQLKDFQQGTNSDPFNGPHNGTVGATTPASGAFTTLSASSTLSVTGAATIQGLTVGRGAGAVSTNTAVGASALATNSSGVDATVVGYQAGYSSTGGYLTAVGYKAGYAVSSGTDNVFMGWNTGLSTTTGSSNVAMGDNAFRTNTTGGNNLALGHAALYSNTTSSSNTAVGYQALYSNTTGTSSNEAFGREALRTNTTGGFNQAFGNSALYYNTTGSYNVAMGTGALQSNTTASNNTAVGYQAGYTATTASDSAYFGYRAGTAATTGTLNTFIGRSAGESLTTASYSTFIGSNAGEAITTGAKNTILGRYNGNQGGLDIRTASNMVVISDGDGNIRFAHESTAQGHVINALTGSNYVVLNYDINMAQKAQTYWDNIQSRFYVQSGPSGGVYVASGGTSWTSASDERAKDIIEPIADAANKVAQLRSVIGKYKTDADGTRRSFLIAQDVLTVLPEAVTVPEEGATEKDGSPAMMGVEYTSVIPLLVAAIKELKAEIDTLKGQA